MPFVVPCPSCNSEFALPDQVVVRRADGSVITLRCRNCNERIRVEGFEMLCDFAPEHVSLRPPPVRSNTNPPPPVQTEPSPPTPVAAELPRPPLVPAEAAAYPDEGTSSIEPAPKTDPSEVRESELTEDDPEDARESGDDPRPRMRAMPVARRLQPSFTAELPPDSTRAHEADDMPPSSGTPDLAALRAKAGAIDTIEDRGPDSTLQRFALQVSTMTQADASNLLAPAPAAAPPPPPLSLTNDEEAPESAQPISVMPISEAPEKLRKTPPPLPVDSNAPEKRATERPVTRSARATPKKPRENHRAPQPQPQPQPEAKGSRTLVSLLVVGAIGFVGWRIWQSHSATASATSEPTVGATTVAPAATPAPTPEPAAAAVPSPSAATTTAPSATSTATAAPAATSAAQSAHASSTASTEHTATTATAAATAAASAAPTAAASAVTVATQTATSDAPPLDQTALRSALESAASQATTCKKDGDPSGSAIARITFMPSGRVTAAVISGPPFAGTTTGGCIAATLRRARIPAFSGDMVTVSKTITIP